MSTFITGCPRDNKSKTIKPHIYRWMGLNTSQSLSKTLV